MAVTGDGRRLFIKALGSDQRDADLLYRAYRFARLRNVGDTWPAASVIRAVEHQALVAVMAERAGVRVPRVDRVIKAGGGTALLVMDQVDGQLARPAPRAADQRRPPAPAVGRSGQAASRRDRPPVPAGGQRDDRGRRAALADRLQLLRAGRHPAAKGPRPRRAAGLAGHRGRRGPGHLQRRRGHRRPAAGGRGAVAAAAGPVRRHPSRHRPPGRPARGHQVGRRRGQRAGRTAAGPPAAGPAPYPAGHRRLGRRLLLRLAPARPRGQQLAGPAIGALGLAAGHHRLLRRDLPGQRGRADRRRARPGTVLAHHPDPGRLVVRQPGLSRQRRRHGPERPVPAENRRLPGPASRRSASTP